jgi:hypothetical protein
MLRNLLVNWQIPIQIGEAKSIIYPYPYAQSCKTVLEGLLPKEEGISQI